MNKKGKRFIEKTKNKKIKLIFITLLTIVFFVLIIISSINIVFWFQENIKNAKIMDEIVPNIIIDDSKNFDDVQKYKINFNELKSKNKDTVAWIKVNGTQVEYPVVQAQDNNYYLTHSFEKIENSAGWIFADYRNKLDGTDKNIVIYGHSRRDKSMFGTLQNALKEDWYNVEENRKIIFATEKENCIYEIFSIYKIESEEYYIETQFEEIQIKDFIETIKNRSIKDFDINVDENDQILTLSTCDYNNKYRVVVHSKKNRIL